MSNDDILDAEEMEAAQAQAMDDLREFSSNMMTVAARSQQLVNEFILRQSQKDKPVEFDPLNIGSVFMEMTQRMLSDPEKMIEAQTELWQNYLTLWQNAATRAAGGEVDPLIQPERGDKRFKDEDWTNNQIFDFIKQSYLLASDFVQKSVHDVEGLDKREQEKVDFYTKQFVDAMSPSNFVMTNPQVLRTTLDEKGENLVRGMEQMLEDLERGDGQLSIKMTDMDAYEVGRNVAITPGKVVFQNELFQLIQYTPTTEQVARTPLLFFPPWINKFYILDLTEEKSMVKWLVDHGHTVFMVSWVNPDSSYRDKLFDDYMLTGQVEALKQVEAITGERAVNVVGYCVAGTLLAATLAYLHAIGEEDRVKSATFFTAQVDFEDSGELRVFVDDEQLETIAEMTEEKGYLDSRDMAMTFNMLRSNDLIWSFAVNNYLLGKEPFPFDLLYWNSDSTNLPRKMHLYYLDNMYDENNLVQPGKLTLAGEPIDLTSIKTPVYLQAGRTDHIAPPESIYKATKIYSGPIKFMLAGSGHIAGVVNPPSANKYQYWTNSKKPATLDEWIDGATEHPGSWWGDWNKWLGRKSGGKVPARKFEDGPYKPIEDAPGSYVRRKED